MVEQVKKDYREANLDAKTRALMNFAVQVTKEQHSVAQGTVDGLRGHGWKDEEILRAVHIIGFFNYYTRMVDALGVELEDFMNKAE